MAMNILIVDDSSLTRKKIRRIIEMVVLDVGQFFEAADGVEALKILEESSVDLVLSDLNMPQMSGSELIAIMKKGKATKDIPVVVITTESQTTQIKDLLAEGVKEYLHKPFTPEEFKEMITGVLGESEPEKDDVLADALTQALETMAFMSVLPMENDLPIPKKSVLAQIGFTGAKSGSVQILGGLDFCQVLAENISGLDESGDKSCQDALKELANVTCGLLLPMVISSTADMFDVTAPTVSKSGDSKRWNEFTSDQNCCVLNVEGNLLAMKLMYQKERATALSK